MGRAARADETTRMREVYAGRAERLAGAGTYSLANDAYLFAIQSRQRALLRLLRREGLWPLEDRDILEVGCGNGGVLLELLGYGADPHRLHGTDLLAERAAVARQRLPHLPISASSGTALPYPDDSFDIVLQFTVFSSILDPAICYTVAREILRVLRSGGAILWYDFWINPLNKQTRGIRPSEIRDYFPGCDIVLERVTLAPPLARRIVPASWSAALLLEKAGFLNTHYLAIVRRPE